jgi:uncharacterized protein YuzB (UPF0349 family)
MNDLISREALERFIRKVRRNLPTSLSPVSNGDVVRGMDDEELAQFLYSVEEGEIDFAMTFCDLCCKDAALDGKSVNCEDCARWWVKNNADMPQGLKYWQTTSADRADGKGE